MYEICPGCGCGFHEGMDEEAYEPVPVPGVGPFTLRGAELGDNDDDEADGLAGG